MRGHDWVRRVVLGSSHSPAPEADEAETLSPRGSAGMGAALAPHPQGQERMAGLQARGVGWFRQDEFHLPRSLEEQMESAFGNKGPIPPRI